MSAFPPALRAALEAGAGEAPAPAAAGRLAGLLKETLAELERLEAGEAEDPELRERWASLGEEALRAARRLSPTRVAGGRYPEAPGAVSRLDLRF